MLILCTISSVFLFVSGSITIRSSIKGPAPQSGKEQPKVRQLGDIRLLEARPVLRPVNLLVLGVDEEGVRSDVMMLINYDPSPNRINILSIARDTRVYVKDEACKINALIGIDGERLAIAGVKELTGIDADYYLTLNFKGFRKIIDALGGVEVDVPITMHYDDPVQNLHIHLQKGRQQLNGLQAEGFIRYRKGNRRSQGYTDGDLGRIRAQQSLIRELVSQKLRLRYLTKVDDIFIILKKYMKTNVDLTEINRYISRLKDIDPANIHSFTVPGESSYQNGVWYFLVNIQGTRDIINSNFTLK